MQGVGTRPLIVAAAAVVLTLGYAGLGAAAAGDLTQDQEPRTLNAHANLDQGLIDALTTASQSGDAPIDRALDAAEAGIQHHLDHGEVTSQAATLGLEAQQTNIDNARDALELINDEDLEPFEQSIRLAQLGILWQAQNLDVPTDETVDAPEHASPSDAIDALLERHDATMTPEQKDAARSLDESAASDELASLLDALIGLETAAEQLADVLPESTTTLEQEAEILDLVERVENGEITSHEQMMEAVDAPESTERATAPSELGPVLVQRAIVLDAALDLHKALEGTEDTHPETFDEEGLLRIDLTEEDSHYEDNYQYIVEAGGANTYHNNAGGTNLATGSCGDEGEDVTTAALIDLGTQDKEFSDPDDYYYCGANGGGVGALAHGSVGVGLLVTAGGDNTYHGSVGANGGGYGGGGGVGIGLAVDGDGQNYLYGGSLGGNGGAANGYFEDIGIGVGLLVLGGGADEVDGFSIGTNGGAVEWGFGNAHGGLISTGGDDAIHRTGSSSPSFGSTGGVYTRSTSVAHAFIVNGGGSNTYGGTVGATGSAHTGGDSVGAAFVVDQDGGSTYTGNHQAVNGAVRGGSGAGLLVSGPGDDTFETNRASGVNGGAHDASDGHALLVNSGGDNHYESGRDVGTNGGVYGAGYGTLYDIQGDDTYVSPGDRGVNGGASGDECAVTLVFACAPSTVGVLLDGSGSDSYEDEAGGTGQDNTVAPKGMLGAQIDLPNTP